MINKDTDMVQVYYLIPKYPYNYIAKNTSCLRPTLLYGTDCWAIKRYHAQKMNVAEMHILRWMCGKMRRNKMRNEDILTKISIAPNRRVDERKPPTMVWSCARLTDASVLRVKLINLRQVKRAKGRPKKT